MSEIHVPVMDHHSYNYNETLTDKHFDETFYYGILITALSIVFIQLIVLSYLCFYYCKKRHRRHKKLEIVLGELKHTDSEV
jgi:hypothetical protein